MQWSNAQARVGLPPSGQLPRVSLLVFPVTEQGRQPVSLGTFKLVVMRNRLVAFFRLTTQA
jgi:hypothetical protein